MIQLFLSLDNAVDIAVREFDIDANLARNEFMQKCYITNDQYKIGFYDGVGESLEAVRNLMDKPISGKERVNDYKKIN